MEIISNLLLCVTAQSVLFVFTFLVLVVNVPTIVYSVAMVI